ncbi:DUF7550 family protein [Halegenticoccus tardaugens]|uniref:DUF7550 family protein n=1 Tax=Halegenticoccus tardaugens TaxID=2071624 RepID=UPI00100B882C|nr:hypothetical protein [Halegenticoccus tardaugens]
MSDHQSAPSERRDAEEEGFEHQEAEDTTAGERSTAPQSAFAVQQVAIGFAVLFVGLVVTFGIPLALA